MRGGGEPIELRRHDEVVLVQALDLLGAQRHRRIAPAERDVGVVHLGFGQLGGTFDKAERLAEILEPVGALDPGRVIGQRPVRRLPAILGRSNAAGPKGC